MIVSEPPIITMIHIKKYILKVGIQGELSIKSSSIAPEIPIIAEPIIKTCKCLLTLIPIAVNISLSLTASSSYPKGLNSFLKGKINNKLNIKY